MQRIRGHVVSSPTDALRTQFLNLKFSGHSRNGDRKIVQARGAQSMKCLSEMSARAYP